MFPPDIHHNYFIVGLNNSSPITLSFVRDKIVALQTIQDPHLIFSLVHRVADNTTLLALTQDMFASLPNLIMTHPFITAYNAFQSIPESYEHFFNAQTKPLTQKS